MTQETDVSLQFERVFDASVDEVFEALTSEAAVAKWFGPSDDFKVTVHAWDCVVGGQYRVQFDTPDGAHICVGRFQEILPGKRLTYTWSWEGRPPMDTLVSFEMEAADGKTQLKMSHAGFPTPDVRDHHQQGWAGSMERLGRLVA